MINISNIKATGTLKNTRSRQCLLMSTTDIKQEVLGRTLPKPTVNKFNAIMSQIIRSGITILDKQKLRYSYALGLFQNKFPL
jgi:hypothetical protein